MLHWILVTFFIINPFVISRIFHLVDEWVSEHTCYKKMLKVARKLCSLINSFLSDDMEGKINDFCTTFTKKSVLFT